VLTEIARADQGHRYDRASVRHLNRTPVRRVAVERLVTAPVVIIVVEKALQLPQQVPLPEDDHVAKEVPADGPPHRGVAEPAWPYSPGDAGAARHSRAVERAAAGIPWLRD
jgi:hypothetical protein